VGSFEYAHSAELGYWLGREYWSRGIATAVVKEFTQFIFETTNTNLTKYVIISTC